MSSPGAVCGLDDEIQHSLIKKKSVVPLSTLEGAVRFGKIKQTEEEERNIMAAPAHRCEK